jgi:SAM-dependent methyltransferase
MISTWSKGSSDCVMPEDLLVESCLKVRRHPWWISRAKLVLSLIRQNGVQPPASVLEAGCGWGVNLDALDKAGYQVTGCDISRRILEYIDGPGRRLAEADLMQDFPPDAGLFDAVLALDVIEHLDDDRAALARLAKMVRPGGLLIVSVPALPDLWSAYDEVQGHRRRYLSATLRQAFGGTTLEVRKIIWWGAWMVPVLRATRLRVKALPEEPAEAYSYFLRLPPWPGPLLMRVAFALEHRRALTGKLKIGTSLLAISVRRG